MLHFQLLAYLWHICVRHRRVWLSGLGLIVIMGVGVQMGTKELGAVLIKHYEKAEKVQQPSAKELRRMRRLQRLQVRLQRRVLEHAAAPKKVVSTSSAFPAFLYTVHPVDKVPDWGRMRTPAEWNRTYQQMTAGDFIPVPPYDLDVLTMPMIDLITPVTEATIPAITAKLYYSTHYWGAYDIDAEEYTGAHAGIDLKLPLGTPIGAIAGGRVVKAVANHENLGMYVMVEHRLPEGTFFSIYGHFGSLSVSAGQDVEPGQELGTIGMTGKTTAPHLHLQIDRGVAGEDHEPFHTSYALTKKQADSVTVHPDTFIREHALTVTAKR